MKKINRFLLSISLFLASTSVVKAVSTAPSPPSGSSTGNSVFGTIQPPAGVDKYGGVEEGGLILFISNGIRLVTTVAGIWVMLNFLLAGWKFITDSGSSKAQTEASTMMTNSIIGLAIVVGAYTIAAIAGLVFFGDASYILNPQIQGV
jgi:hypothetical protein